MFKNKKELDLHVEDTFSKVRGEHEKAMRCFTIAKQYASIKEFSTAIRYMEKYLTTSPSNTAEVLKLIGDYYQESNSFDEALKFYKSSYNTRKTRESLTKICDLIEAGYGGREDQGTGRQKWFDLQKVAPNLPNTPLPHHDSSPANFTSRQPHNGGPPRTGFSKTLMTTSNISSSPKSSTRVNGVSSHEVSFSLSPTKVYGSPDREETQIRNLERRYDDTLAKILSAVQRIEEEMNVMKEKVENITLLQEKVTESRVQGKKAVETDSKPGNGNRESENINNVPPIAQPKQLHPLMQPNPAFGYGVPFPSPYMHPFFMPDPALSYLNNPMLAAAAFYGNSPFGNPLATGGVLPRNEAQPTAIPPNPSEPSLLAGLLTKNQSMPQPTASSQIGDGLYPQNQLIQAQLATSANLTDKLWQAPQLIPTSIALGPMFPSAGTPTSNTNPNGIMNSFENNKNSPVTSTPVKTPTNSATARAEISETPKSSSSSVPAVKKEAKGINLFPENVVVSNTEKVPTVSSSAFNSNVLSVTIPPEHRNAGTSNNNTNNSNLSAFNTSMNVSENKSILQTHNFQISAPVFKPQEPKFDEKKAQDEASNPFSSISLTAPSFGDLAKSAASSGFTGFQSVTAFSGTGTPVFGNVIASQSAAGESVVRQDRADGDEATDEFVPTAEFQPVIPLPPLVEVKKGNENENTLFEHRAKIYRFVKETKEWKERGVGNIMILQDKDNPRKIRVVMWRERVFKLACNHWITKDLVIENHQGSPKILKWTVLDFAEADSDPKVEIFTCRFAQEEKCAEFKATMERMVTYLASQGEETSPVKNPQEKIVTTKPFAELFKKAPGSWECKMCYVNNEEKKASCVSCGTPKETKLSKGTEKSLAELFKVPEGSWSCETCDVKNGKDVKLCAACTTPKPGYQPEVVPFKPDSVPFTFGFSTMKNNVVNNTSSLEKSEEFRAYGPNTFDFSQINKPQTMTNDPNQKLSKPMENAKPSILTAAARSEAPVFKPQEPKLDEKKAQGETANPFSSISLTAPSFGDLAKSAASSGFTGFQSVNAFSGTGTPVFGNMITSQAASGESVVSQDRTDGDEATDDFVPTAEFQPVIPLPPLVEVKKGNENENTLFEHRAKIYRFVKETKEWKERGVGNIMILQDKDNPRKIRVVMWRERVFKLACNHWITKDLVIENHQGSPKILKWTVLDFAEADSDPKVEIFTCRFAQEEKCAEFKATMERMVTYLTSEGEDSSSIKNSQEKEVTIKPFAELFKKAPGSWECNGCYVTNNVNDGSCISCGTPKETQQEVSIKPFAELFKKAPGSWECNTCYVTNNETDTSCASCKTPKEIPPYKPDTGSFTFGFPTLKNNVNNTSSADNFKEIRGPDSFDFSQLNKQSMPLLPNDTNQNISKESEIIPKSILSVENRNADKTEEAVNPFSSISLTAPSFGDLAKSAASSGFTGFQIVNAFSGTGTPVFGNMISSTSGAGDRAEGDEATDDFVPTAEFQPVIPLPPLVEIKKGNENENTLFEHRAKIYRFVKETKEWKERGVGNIMILQDKDNPRKIRVVMWRERVFKLACNHWITKDLVIENHQGSPKILKWTVLDFAEADSDPKVEIFTCRFAQEEKCAEFKATMERMVTYLASQGEDTSPIKNPQEKEVSIKPFAELFKKAPGSWECKMCYVNNEEKDASCVSCGTPKETQSPVGTDSSLTEGGWVCGTCDSGNEKDTTTCVSCKTVKPGSQPDVVPFKPDTVQFNFGFIPPVPNKETSSVENCPGCRGCDPDSFDFSQLDKRTLPLPPKDPIHKITQGSKKAVEQISSN